MADLCYLVAVVAVAVGLVAAVLHRAEVLLVAEPVALGAVALGLLVT